VKPKIAILDYGIGNLRSVERGLAYGGAAAMITSDAEVIESSDALVLPGVGAFCDAIKQLQKFEKILKKNKKPVLGICLGMQLLFTESEEDGLHRGLNLMQGRVVKLPKSVKIPQMGWNSIDIKRKGALLEGIKDGEYFYFVHSYYAAPEEDVTIATAEYGVKFAAVVEKGNIYAAQFHPEKSGAAGLRVLKNFIDIVKGFI
jgi:glutamine amidotransferase